MEGLKAPSSVHEEIDRYWEDPTFREIIDSGIKAVRKHYIWTAKEHVEGSKI